MIGENSVSETSRFAKLKQLSIFHYNSRSLVSKFDELCASIELHNPDIIIMYCRDLDG